MRYAVTTGIFLELLLGSMLAFALVKPLEVHPIEAEVVPAGGMFGMPDFGQHSGNWCWVAAAANCFYLMKHGEFPELYPDSWDEIALESMNASDEDWYCPCDNGYSKLLQEICRDGSAEHEETLVFCSRFFLTPWQDYVDPYVACLEKFIADQEFSEIFKIHSYEKPTFYDYKREIDSGACVIILYRWGGPEDIHLLTGVSYEPGITSAKIWVSDPGTPLQNGDVCNASVNHNNNPDLMDYDRWVVTKEDPLEIRDAHGIPGEVRHLFCISLQRMWIVDDDGPADFHTIQEAINAAQYWDTIYVRTGTYYEHVVVNKTVSLIGEDREMTIVDGEDSGHAINVTAAVVVIGRLMVRNSGWPNSGIYLDGIAGAYRVTVERTNIDNCDGGISLIASDYNTISENRISNCNTTSVYLYASDYNTISRNSLSWGAGNFPFVYSSYNSIYENNFNSWHLVHFASSSDNLIYHNNFAPARTYEWQCTNVWDDGYPSCGNFWSDYSGTDFYGGSNQNLPGSDGIGDTPYVIDGSEGVNFDNYPLMNPSTGLKGDIDGDWDVDLDDLLTFVRTFGINPEEPGYNTRADLDNDGDVDVIDLFISAVNYGKTIL